MYILISEVFNMYKYALMLSYLSSLIKLLENDKVIQFNLGFNYIKVKESLYILENKLKDNI